MNDEFATSKKIIKKYKLKVKCVIKLKTLTQIIRLQFNRKNQM